MEEKMLSKIRSMSLLGVDGYFVDVQVDIAGGLPSWEIVGLPDTSVRESKERVKAAIQNTGIEFKSRNQKYVFVILGLYYYVWLAYFTNIQFF